MISAFTAFMGLIAAILAVQAYRAGDSWGTVVSLAAVAVTFLGFAYFFLPIKDGRKDG